MSAFPTRTVIPGDGDKTAFHARGDARGVLCLHGFTGTPFETRPIAEGLAARGYTVRAPVLAGHCERPETLEATRWTDWLASAARACNQLQEEVGGPVAVAGFSMGGLLALHLAHDRPRDICAVMVSAVPMSLGALQTGAVALVNAVPWALRRGRLRFLPKLGYDVTDEDMRRRNPGLPVMPLAGVAQMLALGQAVRARLPAITTPALVVHGLRDRTIALDDSLELVAALGSATLQRLWLPRSGHLVGLDVERGALLDAVDGFFASAFVRAPGPPAEARP